MDKEQLEKIHIVHTPESWDEIVKFTEGASTPADAATAACMAWNFAVDWVYEQNNCCDQLREIKASLEADELTYAEHLAAKLQEIE
jgi:hypothetical protein